MIEEPCSRIDEKSRHSKAEAVLQRSSTQDPARPLIADAIVTVCTKELAHELREFLPSVNVAFPRARIFVATDISAAELRALCESLHLTEKVTRIPLRIAEARKRIRKVSTVSDYWNKEYIWVKLDALQRVQERLPDSGILMLDCDITFAAPFERHFFGDVVLSPFYWGNLQMQTHADPADSSKGCVPIWERDGLFNAGMLLTRSADFCRWWKETYESGEFGFYEQKCLDQVPRLFHADYFSPLHNFGKWRFESPWQEVRSYHYHLRETARRQDCLDIKLAAQQAAARARYLLKEAARS